MKVFLAKNNISYIEYPILSRFRVISILKFPYVYIVFRKSKKRNNSLTKAAQPLTIYQEERHRSSLRRNRAIFWISLSHNEKHGYEDDHCKKSSLQP